MVKAMITFFLISAISLVVVIKISTFGEKKDGLKFKLMMAIAKIESNCGKYRVGKHGELGAWQIKPKIARNLGYKGSKQNLRDNHQVNYQYAKMLLSELYTRYNGDLLKTLDSYNKGLRNLNRNSKYVSKILNAMNDNNVCGNLADQL